MIGLRHLALTVAVATLALPAPAAAAPTSYSDPSGDNGAAADIGAVTVQLAADGYLHVRPVIAAQPALLSPGAVLVGFDSDRSLATGAVGGMEYLALFVFDDSTLELVKWNGSDWDVAPTQEGDVRALVGSSGFELLLRPAALGGVTAFNFQVAASTGSGDAAQFDFAPNEGTWSFEHRGPAAVETIDATFVPAKPRAGAVFQPVAVRLECSDGTSTLARSYRCVATLGGKLLRGTGRGGCTLRLPKAAKGKRLVVTLFVTYGGTTSRYEPYVFRVR